MFDGFSSARRARRPLWPMIALGGAAMIFFAFRSFSTENDVRAFAGDASCTAGFTVTVPVRGALCAVRPATIVAGSASRRQGRGGASYFVSLDLGGGRIDRVRLAAFSHRAWVEMRSGEPVAVTAHLFRDRVDAFESPSGIVTTSGHPTVRSSRNFLLTGIFFGVIAVVCALLVTFFPRRTAVAS